MIELVVVAAAGSLGFVKLRDFVRDRLRYVDSAQTRSAPWVAGVGVGLASLPIVAMLPILGPLTAIVSGVVVGTAFRSGQKAIKQLNR